MSREIKCKAFDEYRSCFVRTKLVENESSNWIDERGFPVVWYTGLKDRNGVEIYEGDILKGCSADDDAEFTTKVRWVPSCFIVDVVGQDFDLCDLGAAIRELCHEYEVIGNIHENPDLLK